MLIQMVQQLSGRRPDGRFWPEVGGQIEVSDEEGRALCQTDPHQSHPIAIPVRQDKEERAVADESAVEVRTEAPPAITAEPASADPPAAAEVAPPPSTPPVAPRTMRPPPRPARPVTAEKRG